MKAPDSMTRREVLKFATVAALGLPFAGLLNGCRTPAGGRMQPTDLKLGVASYSLNKMSPEQVIATLQEFQIHYVSLFKTHCPWGGTAEECRAAAKKFTDAGLTITGSGVIELPNKETTVRKAFENARAAGLPTMVCKPAVDALPLVEKFVKEYDQRLAIHNHGPEDKAYPSPYDAWKVIQSYDQRIGLCIDVGHCARAGTDPVEAIRTCQARLYDIHLKDSLAPAGAANDKPTEVGSGRLDIKGILGALVEVKYRHIVAFEYEKGGNDVVKGLGESIAFVRKTLAEMAA